MEITRNRRLNRNRAFRTAFEAMEPRQMMSASAIKSVDTDGPDDQMLTVNGSTYVISSDSSGGGWSQIYSTKGASTTTKHLVDANKSGSTINTISDLAGTADSRVFFVAQPGAPAAVFSCSNLTRATAATRRSLTMRTRPTPTS